jgi:hypothetical protein
MMAGDSLDDMAGGWPGSRDEEFSPYHIDPNSIYLFMDRTENKLDRIQGSNSVGCFYNVLSEAYSSMLTCCVLWYTETFGAQAEQKYLGDFVGILEEFITGAPELDSLLEQQGDPDIDETVKATLTKRHNEHMVRLLTAVGGRASSLKKRLKEDKAGRYETFAGRLDELCGAMRTMISSHEYLGGCASHNVSLN